MTPICACRKPKPTEVIVEHRLQMCGDPDVLRLRSIYVGCSLCGLSCLFHPEGGS